MLRDIGSRFINWIARLLGHADESPIPQALATQGA